MNEDELIIRLRPDATSTVAPASQIKVALERLIESGELEEGERLPVERRLAEQLGISRLTVRQALDDLARSGVVTRRQGSGTYVNGNQIQGSLRVLAGFTDEMSGDAHSMTTRVIELGFQTPDATVRKELDIDASAIGAVKLVRVRTVDGVPSTYETSWMPRSIGAPLVIMDMDGQSLFRTLAETQDIRPDHAIEQLRATLLGATEAELLACAPGDPAFLVKRTTYDKDGRAIEYAESVLRGDRFFYSTTLEAPSRLNTAADFLSRYQTLTREDT